MLSQRWALVTDPDTVELIDYLAGSNVDSIQFVKHENTWYSIVRNELPGGSGKHHFQVLDNEIITTLNSVLSQTRQAWARKAEAAMGQIVGAISGDEQPTGGL